LADDAIGTVKLDGADDVALADRMKNGREQIIKEIREDYDGNVIWGEDLMEIPVEPSLAKME